MTMSLSPVAANTADTNFPEIGVFSVSARAEPGVMPRVLELFAKRGLVPSFWRSAVGGVDQARLTIDIAMNGLDRDVTEYIAACLRQIAFVETVLTPVGDKAGKPGLRG
jgi:acetolactate synthase small subunit